MKRILVTGAAGTIGIEVLKYLLSEGKYEITALDLKNRKVYNIFKKYRKRVNIIYGDVCDRVLMESLVKNHDYIIHLASVLPPLGSLKKDLAKLIEYDAIENLTRSINYYNPNCFLIYASSTTLFNGANKITKKSRTTYVQKDYYSLYKFMSEKLIKEKLKKYSILRLPLVLPENSLDFQLYNINKKIDINCITKSDAAYAFIKIIDEDKILNKKSINLSGNDTFNMKYKDLLSKLLKNGGLSYKLILNDLFIDKNYNSPLNETGEEYNDLLNYQNDTFDKYINRLKYNSKKKNISKFLGYIYIKFLEKK